MWTVMNGELEADAAPLGLGTAAQQQEQPSSRQHGQGGAQSRNSSRKRSKSRISSSRSSSNSSDSSADGSSTSSGGSKSRRSSKGGGGGSGAGSKKGRKRSSSSSVAGGSGGLVLAGGQYTSLLDLRYRMRVLQRQLLSGAAEVEVPRGSPHFETIQALFQLHPGYSQKVREPIASFYVVSNPQVAGGKGFEFQFVDARGPEARSDFSLLKCTRPQCRPKRNMLLEACAAAVEGQLAEVGARAEVGPSGARLCSRCRSDFKVELIYTRQSLSKLVQAYVEGAAATAAGPPPSKFVCVAGSQQAAFRQHVEAEAAWQRGWQRYHWQHAGLELLCKRCLEAMRAEAGAWRERGQQRGQQPPQQQEGQGGGLGGAGAGQRFNVWKQQQEQLDGPEQPPPPGQQQQQQQQQQQRPEQRQQQPGGSPKG